MPATLTCCRCVELRRGCAIIGYCLLVLYGAAGLALTAAACYAHQHNWREATALAVSAPLALLPAAFHVLLTLGALHRRPPLLLAWMIGCGTLFTAQTAALLIGAFLLTAGSLWVVLSSTAALAVLQALLWYWFWAVRSLYLELTTERRARRRASALDDTDHPTQTNQQKKAPAFGE